MPDLELGCSLWQGEYRVHCGSGCGIHAKGNWFLPGRVSNSRKIKELAQQQVEQAQQQVELLNNKLNRLNNKLNGAPTKRTGRTTKRTGRATSPRVSPTLAAWTRTLKISPVMPSRPIPDIQIVPVRAKLSAPLATPAVYPELEPQ